MAPLSQHKKSALIINPHYFKRLSSLSTFKRHCRVLPKWCCRLVSPATDPSWSTPGNTGESWKCAKSERRDNWWWWTWATMSTTRRLEDASPWPARKTRSDHVRRSCARGSTVSLSISRKSSSWSRVGRTIILPLTHFNTAIPFRSATWAIPTKLSRKLSDENASLMVATAQHRYMCQWPCCLGAYFIHCDPHSYIWLAETLMRDYKKMERSQHVWIVGFDEFLQQNLI